MAEKVVCEFEITGISGQSLHCAPPWLFEHHHLCSCKALKQESIEIEGEGDSSTG